MEDELDGDIVLSPLGNKLDNLTITLMRDNRELEELCNQLGADLYAGKSPQKSVANVRTQIAEVRRRLESLEKLLGEVEGE